MATILITGGTGMVGKRLTKILLEKGFQVNILTRDAAVVSAHPLLHYYQWDVSAGTIDAAAISTADDIVHLAGAGVADKRWNTKRKQEIVDSRVQSGAIIVKALQSIPNQVQTVLSASGIGWYGADNAQSMKDGFTEDAVADTEFLGETCKLWENAIKPVKELKKRLVIFRIGIVLSTTGGALVEFMKPIKFGFATILGSGKQNISWIHIDDLCHSFIYALENKDMSGVYNAVAPETVSNKSLTVSLAKKLKGSFYLLFYIPAFLLKIILGGMSIEVLKSAKVNSYKLQATGFMHQYPSLQKALKNLLH